MDYREILIVHPEQTIRGLMEGYLHSEFEDMMVVEASSSEQAEELLSEKAFDLILGSSALPDALGVQFYVRARRSLQNAETPFVMVVDADSKEPSSRFFQHGIEHVLHLPFSSDALHKKVRALTNPRNKRKMPRFSFPGIEVHLLDNKERFKGRVINLSQNSILSEVDCSKGFPHLLGSSVMDLVFPAELNGIHIEGISCRLSRVRVLEWNDFNGPQKIRVAWAFVSLEGRAARDLGEALDLIEQAYIGVGQ
ncbi:MAG: response regulator [bacterium]|nr:response regulator [bacterium]